MNTKIKLGILAVIFLLSSYLIYNYVGDGSQINNEIITNDEKKFKEEYEQYNGKYDEKRNINYLDVSVIEDNNVKYSSAQEIISLLEKGTGVIYFGFPDCPWCRNAMPVLINTAKELKVKTIYYLNALEMRDIKHLDEEGNIIVDKEGTEEYYKILSLLGDKASIYNGLNNDNEKRLYFPTVVFAKEGKVLSINVATVESQDDPSKPLTSEQTAELQSIYEEGINSIYDVICDKNC